MENEFLTHCIVGSSNKGVGVQEYKGEINIVSVWEGREGNLMMNWCYPQYKKAAMETAVPWKINLGERKQAIATLRQFLVALGESPKGQGAPQNKGVDEDLPF